MKKFLLIGLICISVAHIQAQVITHGPIVGAVSPKSARITARLNQAGTITFQLSTTTDFSNPVGNVSSGSVDTSLFATISVTSLQPNTEYFYRPVINQIPVTTPSEIRRFRTALDSTSTSPFAFAFGSCQQDGGAPSGTSKIGNVFPRIAADNSIRFMLQMGDWGYPDTTDTQAFPTNYFNLDYNNVRNSYLSRYDRNYKMDSVFKVMPVAYTWSDHDHANNNTDSTFNGPNRFSQVGYRAMFPHYTLVDQRGIWQKFRYGNSEFFVLDTRSTRDPNLNGFPNAAGWIANPLSVSNPTGTRLQFNPPATHKIISDDQMSWLIESLKSSTATWKFIVSAEAFNPAQRATMEVALSLQGVPGIDPLTVVEGVFTAGQIAVDVSDGWCGFYESVKQLVSAVRESNITNVIVLSADSHNIGTDNGANSLFPEFMAGGLDQNNSRNVNAFETFGIFVWNRARQSAIPGFGAANNFNSHFGRVTVFGNDSVRVDYFDDQGVQVGSYNQPAGHLVASRNLTVAPQGYDYGTLPVSKDSLGAILLVNNGIDTVVVNAVSNLKGAAGRATVPSFVTFPIRIAPKGISQLPVNFRPSTSGLNIDTLIIVSNDPDNNGFGAGVIPTIFRGNGQAPANVAKRENSKAKAFVLEQNYPNPFNPTTNIRYSLPSTQDVTFRIYDALGRVVVTLLNQRQNAGTYTIKFNAGELASGVYFYQLKAGTFVEAKKMLLVK
ncbi:MAG: alkaline phosphatase D family protein [Chloroherpetonaceae bacterium]|nr:alkaline phosphatase D family protein [Chloroherpetonaceae bacterium]